MNELKAWEMRKCIFVCFKLVFPTRQKIIKFHNFLLYSFFCSPHFFQQLRNQHKKHIFTQWKSLCAFLCNFFHSFWAYFIFSSLVLSVITIKTLWFGLTWLRYCISHRYCFHFTSLVFCFLKKNKTWGIWKSFRVVELRVCWWR